MQHPNLIEEATLVRAATPSATTRPQDDWSRHPLRIVLAPSLST
jgi:hypothetical protein